MGLVPFQRKRQIGRRTKKVLESAGTDIFKKDIKRVAVRKESGNQCFSGKVKTGSFFLEYLKLFFKASS